MEYHCPSKGPRVHEPGTTPRLSEAYRGEIRR